LLDGFGSDFWGWDAFDKSDHGISDGVFSGWEEDAMMEVSQEGLEVRFSLEIVNVTLEDRFRKEGIEKDSPNFLHEVVGHLFGPGTVCDELRELSVVKGSLAEEVFTSFHLGKLFFGGLVVTFEAAQASAVVSFGR
jgi:hypothetical protein